eukprot:3975053-Pleurochrysis_carterae.AAC.6
MYSAPASRAAVRMATVRRMTSLATGGPPSGDELDRKWRLMEKVEHGGEAMTAAYSPPAQR